MVLLDTFDSDLEAAFLIENLKKAGIQFTEKKAEEGLQVFINEADMGKINDLISKLD
ncbi:hypothetical protein K7J14_15630 [Treponema zuelzerae]|uniref:DUF2007 domain-containing protein n=1 Tax=Teretinema zuelzerae TaxID=156 RepID=A0AAE3EKV6_9SPIR|nr:hypothetical protein [Teretinema zuelzerae]MCD1656131.1 hypothetical protein [Teretinema zuelzerae]HPO02091.1 hypothetical protein [Treponemataceae bacterium]